MQGLDVFIIGTPFSGSTFLGNILNAHGDIFCAGEVSHLFKDFPHGSKSDFCPLCLAMKTPCSVFDANLVMEIIAARKGAALSVIREKTHSPIIVDTSKFPHWLEAVVDDRLAGDIDKQTVATSVSEPVLFNARIVLLTRSPFGFYASAKRRQEFSMQATLQQWSGLYARAFELLDSLGIKPFILQFEALLKDPHAVLKDLCTYLEIEFQEKMLTFWQVPAHSLGGNSGSYMWFKGYGEKARFISADDYVQAAQYADRQFDVRKTHSWKTKLSAEDILLVQHHSATRLMARRLCYDMDKLVTDSIYSF